ncbi:phosphate ABC transporter, solute-binding protein [Methanolacinia petrolearia DSM 11571]|uniref:Phosphate ABC transporter, solute-binding protein n=1 Tax=Methanolacinia petrolearia (strain DSM 11571 / OCM 486 / SEBR 4847) TaxID=679926 RepID=E1RG72_METP4|nr:PstS family phosphate ABC transporter substrate-binding protein [Methanolacinia petrolearia]ADN37386.1 phosphate ABC transporter, solute-binding protein [Methanolacinia petrolearia DSM 11571]
MKVFAKDENAVSPIVATLVLIVVAVVGAVSVGTIMGTFSDDVSGQTNAGDVSNAAATEILIAGSTTVQPVSELLAEAYMKENRGVKITVQGGGSGAGVSAAGMGIADIGAASRNLKDEEAAKYTDLQTKQIGGSAVVVIVNENVTGITSITEDQLEAIFINDDFTSAPSGITTAFQRSEESGTEDTFSEFLTGKSGKINASIDGATGNAGVLESVRSTTDSIGFVDAGYALDASGVTVLNIQIDTTIYEATSKGIQNALSGKTGESECYVTGDDATSGKGLVRPLNYIVGSSPSSIVNDFISFAQSPGAIEYFDEAGMYSIMSF